MFRFLEFFSYFQFSEVWGGRKYTNFQLFFKVWWVGRGERVRIRVKEIWWRKGRFSRASVSAHPPGLPMPRRSKINYWIRLDCFNSNLLAHINK